MRKLESVVQESLEKNERREGTKTKLQQWNNKIRKGRKDYGSKLCKRVQKGKGRKEGVKVKG